MISMNASGDRYMVFVSDMSATSMIYIYTMEGKLVTQVKPEGSSVELPALPSGQMYILKYSDNEGGLKRKNKSGKFFYAI